MNGGDEIPVLVDKNMSDRLSIPLLKRANQSADMVRALSTADTVDEGRARNAALRAYF